jgi:hypothetical protein
VRVLCAAAFVIALSNTPAMAEEPVACDKFKWPVDKEIVALRAPNLEEVTSSELLSTVPFAGTVLLVPLNSVSLPKEPERSPKNDTFSGYLRTSGIMPGMYSISLSDAAWVDVVEHDRFLKAKAHSGVQGCRGIRKVLRFELRGDPLIIQISGASIPRLNFAILPAE